MAYLRKVTPKYISEIDLRMEELNKLEDFTLTEEEQPVPVEDVAALFKERGHEFCVYAINWDEQLVTLVKTAEGTDVKAYSTLMEAQRRFAEEVFVFPLSDLQTIADAVAEDVKHVREIFLYTTGHCNCELLVKALNVLPSVQGVNEAQVYSALANAAGRVPRMLLNIEATAAMIKNVTTLLNYFFLKSDPALRSTIVYQLLPDVFTIGDLMMKAHPEAQTVFEYKTGLQYFDTEMKVTFDEERQYNNFRRALQTERSLYEWHEEIPFYMQSYGDGLNAKEEDMNMAWYVVTTWQGTMQTALKLQDQHPDNYFHAVLDHQALLDRKEEAVLELLETLGIEVEIQDAVYDTLAEVLAKNGEPKASWAGDWEIEFFTNICNRTGWDDISPDFVFPDAIC